MCVYNGILFSYKEGNSIICDNMGKTGRCYGKSSKVDRRQLLHGLTYM